jgi:predicted DCC family thiol-disulfide oxidoreductase YuxK
LDSEDLNIGEKEIVIFDGFCNFCSGSALFIMRRDPSFRFRFAASQSPAGQRILQEYGITELARHSIVLIRKGRVYRRSGAALRIARGMKGLWPLLYGLIMIPPFIRDFFYGLFARYRYRLYGVRDSCFVPGPEIRERFLV